MPQREVIATILAEQRGELINYARTVSGDADGAEDLVQEAWLRLDQAARAEPIAKPAHLLWRILRNLAIDRGRRITREKGLVAREPTQEQLEQQPDRQPSIEDMLIARDELARIGHVINGFDARTRAAFEMHRFEGAKLREIAAHLGISVTAAHGLVATALRAIRAALDHD
ncbi:MAG TPA: sigma-70 family RNA polymerase sigma factor [Novosphingobium sp.]|nr:sigma-70 family RNA polymerase sigma factor [Novosphingobium sp.]HZV10027.1 sigma-70 family RNA polymerase sigma factor [Novosphingobium sp.]